MSQFSAHLEAIHRFKHKRILCVGDLMLDRYVHGEVNRISPEAPVPVLYTTHKTSALGGVGNVAMNMAKLGACPSLIGVLGGDSTGNAIQRLLKEEYTHGSAPGIMPMIFIDSWRTSTKKTRYMCNGQQLLRADIEKIEMISDSTIARMVDSAKDELKSCAALVLSDYGKGTMSRKLNQRLISLARSHNIPAIVDPKSKDFEDYRRATIVTPNLRELEAVAGRQLRNHDEIAEICLELMLTHEISNILVTIGKDGMVLVTDAGDVRHFPATAIEVVDVSGAGDTVTAILALAMSAGLSLLPAVELANLAAGIVVGKAGTATIDLPELASVIESEVLITGSRKLMQRPKAQRQAEAWRETGKRVGFTNGCFDLLHQGHLSLLERAKEHCDKLIVAINSDASVKRLKGESRPIHGELARASMLAALSCVDMVTIFDDDSPLDTIAMMEPVVLFKGGDYAEKKIIGADLVQSYGGKVIILPIENDISTTSVIDKAKGVHLAVNN